MTSLRAAYHFAQMIEMVRVLRGPEGCPWDRKQQLRDFLPFLKEEALEVLLAGHEALEGDHEHFEEELGDLFFVMLFVSRLCEEQGQFSAADSLQGIVAKMLRRHPHVFADAPRDQASIKQNWQRIKAEEKRLKREQRKRAGKPVDAEYDDGFKSILQGAHTSWGALDNALEVSKRVVKVGFEWPNVWNVWDKVLEEVEELREVLPEPDAPISQARRDGPTLIEHPELQQRQRDELGDLLFTLVNLGRHLGIDAEEALRTTCQRFASRFLFIEKQLHVDGKRLEDTPLEELEALWQQAKRHLHT
jgi:ATP diphosphatase